MSDVSIIAQLVWNIFAIATGVLVVYLICSAASGFFDLRKEAIDRGFAEYDSKTGEWKWKEKERG